MDNNLAETIKNRVAQLPEDVQRAILDVGLSDRIQTIDKKHQLHIDQMGTLEDETLLVMIGLTQPKDFVEKLQKQLALPPEKAAALAGDVSNEVFMPVRISLREPQEPHPADLALSAKTVSVPPAPTPPAQNAAIPPAPSRYKTDPYREPAE